MKSKDLSQLSLEELKDKINQDTEAYNSLTLKHRMTPIENPIQIRQYRRNIARMNTILSQKTRKEA